MVIKIKQLKTKEEYITIKGNEHTTMYTYVLDCNNSIFNKSKSSFNKYAFIEYLKSIGISKKIIKQVEEY